MESWITAIGSLVLVGVTAWYAVLTRRLAISARESAASAERTAQIAADALAASVAGLDIGFGVFPNWRANEKGDGDALGVSITSTGAAVFVHGARIDELWLLEGDERDDGYSSVLEASDHALVLDEDFALNADGVALPVRLHRGESVHFVTQPEVGVEVSKIAQLDVSVSYSLSPGGEQLVRRSTYDFHDE